MRFLLMLLITVTLPGLELPREINKHYKVTITLRTAEAGETPGFLLYVLDNDGAKSQFRLIDMQEEGGAIVYFTDEKKVNSAIHGILDIIDAHKLDGQSMDFFRAFVKIEGVFGLIQLSVPMASPMIAGDDGIIKYLEHLKKG